MNVTNNVQDMTTSRINKGIFSSRTNEWATPKTLFRSLNKEFHFDLDVAASSKNATCKNYFTKKTNGLKQDWYRNSKTKTVFCNPPYGKGVENWLKKAIEESKKGCTVVCLIPIRTDTKYFHQLIYDKAGEVRLIKGRLKYDDKKQSAPFPSAIIIYRKGKTKTSWTNVDSKGILLDSLDGTEINSPSYYRARINAIKKLIEELPTNRDEKNPDRTLIRNGFIPETQQKRFDEILDYEYKLSFALNEPLTFTEITSFNTWFVLHPEKICGKEVVTTSREFPITIKGTKEDIIRTIHAGLNQTIEMKTEPEPEKTMNRFGNAKKVLGWTVSDYNSFYYDEMHKFLQTQEPIEKQIAEFKKEIKEAGRDKAKRNELTTKLNDTIQLHNQNKNAFDSDWIDFCMELRNIIIETAKNKGLQINDEDNSDIPDDILLAISDRPGIEYYWNTKISEVIDKELQYFIQPDEKQNTNLSELELEALALETELQLFALRKEKGKSYKVKQ